MAFVIDFLASHDRESIIAELKRIAALLGKRSLSVNEIDEQGFISSHTVSAKFGSIRKAHEAAGLIALRYTKSTDAELLKAVADLWTITLREHSRRPCRRDVPKYKCPVSYSTIVLRFGSWKKALIATAAAYAVNPSGAPPATAFVPRKRKRKPISERRRFLVMKRDRYTCCICRKSGLELEIDHIIPVSRGGDNKMENLQTLCKPCNRGKSSSLQ